VIDNNYDTPKRIIGNPKRDFDERVSASRYFDNILQLVCTTKCINVYEITFRIAIVRTNAKSCQFTTKLWKEKKKKEKEEKGYP
jgi:hypothetical protein